MKNVLIVSPFLPYPLVSGGHQAIYNSIVAAIPNANVFFTYPEIQNQETDRAALMEQLGGKVLICPYINHQDVRGKRILNFIYKTKYIIKKTISRETIAKENTTPYERWIHQLLPQSKDFINHVNSLISRYKIDIVQCEMLDTLSLVLSLPQETKKIFIHHEIGFTRNALHPIVAVEHSPEGLAHLEINKIIEVSLLNKFDTVVTLSQIDSEKLKMAGVKPGILPSFAIVNTLPEKNPVSERYNVLTFVGPEWHLPNKDGLSWFLEHCWPLLKKNDNSYQLRVVGEWSEETKVLVSARFHDVNFSGFVEDLHSELRNTIMIVPIRIGSGIRMKILEACMLGIPVVSTSVGAEGLSLTHGTDCLIDDTPEGFVQAIQQLKDKTLRLNIISSAQEKILQRYSLDALVSNRKELYI